MPIVSHYACKEPAPETVICRFLDFTKFRDLFANEELYFRRTDLFKETDPQEALPPDDYVRKALGLKQYVLEDELKLNAHQAFVRQNSEGYFITCWQLFDDETIEMWNTYGKGVAIFSRFDLLREQVKPFLDPIFLGEVTYGHKDMVGQNLINFLFTKQRHFYKEKELRIVLQCYDPMAGANRNYDESGFPHREPLDVVNPLHKWVHDCKRRRIDLKSLVTEVRMSPWATREEVEEVWWWRKVKNFSWPIVSSDLAIPRTPIPPP